MTEATFRFGELKGRFGRAIELQRSDETWLPEWSGKLGGVKRCAVRSHLKLEGASLADKRAEIAPYVWRVALKLIGD
jgi:hypothetical protein